MRYSSRQFQVGPFTAELMLGGTTDVTCGASTLGGKEDIGTDGFNRSPEQSSAYRRDSVSRVKVRAWGVSLLARSATREGLLVFGLTLVSLLLRFIAIFRVEVICRDGLLYCHLAQCIEEHKWLQSNDDWFLFNPYPPLIALLHRGLGINLEFAGQLASAVPAALAVIPLYYWCREAFGARIAVATGWIYALHPILIRNSAEVMREGLYWFCMLLGIQLFWAAVRRESVWRFFAGGVCATLATLVRIEGCALFVLFPLWALCASFQRHRSWSSSLRLWSGAVVACVMFPLTIGLLNLTLLPAGSPVRGLGRFQHLTGHVANFWGGGQASRSTETLAATSPGSNLPHNPGLRTVRDIANSIQVWSPENVADPDLYCLRRFLLLADEQREALYIGQFLNRLLQGFHLTVLFWFTLGIASCRHRWQIVRDLPLLLMSLLLISLIFLHLATEFALESRYLFCLIPFILPWAGYGLRLNIHWWYALCRREGRPTWGRVGVVAASLLLITLTIGQTASSHDPEKVFQKSLGRRLQHAPHQGRTIAGPEHLQRAGFYAGLPFQILPCLGDKAVEWVARSRPDYIVLGHRNPAVCQPLASALAKSPEYTQILNDVPEFRGHQIFQRRESTRSRVTHTAGQTTSFTAN